MSHRKVRQAAGQKGGRARSKKKLAAVRKNIATARLTRWKTGGAK